MPPDPLSVLVAVAEPDLREEVFSALAADGIEVLLADEPAGCLGRSSDRVDALVLADRGLCSTLVADRTTRPPIMLLTDGGVDDRVSGLKAGADDCLSRPVAGRELAIRLRAIARRADGRTDTRRSYADLRLDRPSQRAWRGERELGLTATEFALLDLLVERAERVVARPEIHTRVWGYDFGSSSNSLRVYVGYLRRKLEEPGRPRLLHTVRGFGYVLRKE